VNIQVHKSRFDKKYHACVGNPQDYGFERTGDTKTAAYAACQEAVEAQANNLMTRKYVFTNSPDGAIFCLYYADGWAYDIIRPGQSFPSGCQYPQSMSYNEALESMMRHVEQAFGGEKKVNKEEQAC
jgi:hypothetical protein